ncbi:hypothetical protein [uncultured Allofournierella sp.]|uniref:hypothetical protein n=1 Tax=uncultured Allofournierella sp. TaxID=1940258 RepID=UPI0025EA513F|nr:hypothetical protein [uncultured Fournierella sp.]
MKKKVLIFVLVLGVVFAVIAIPIIINELYLINSGYITVWEGADVLAFYGALLGAIGTVVLGLVAWRQNERLLKLEETKYNLEIRPFVILTDWKVSPFDIRDTLERFSNGKIDPCYIDTGDLEHADFQVFLTFTNTTDSFVTAKYYKSEYVKTKEDTGWQPAAIFSLNLKMRMQPNENGEICLLGTRDSLNNAFKAGIIKIYFLMENRLGDKYLEEFHFGGRFLGGKDLLGNELITITANNYKVYPSHEPDLIFVTDEAVKQIEQEECTCTE